MNICILGVARWHKDLISMLGEVGIGRLFVLLPQSRSDRSKAQDSGDIWVTSFCSVSL
jgi:hypothetical protein